MVDKISPIPSQYLGCGLGLRAQYYQEILQDLPPVDWFEIITEDYIVPGGRPLHFLDQIRSHYPIVMHGVSLSIGSIDPLNFDYLAKVKQLAARVDAEWISDHCCWTGINGLNLHDLLPLPHTEEVIKHVAERIQKVQDYLGYQIAIENASSYISYKESGMNEWDFLTELVNRADCKILLDINNVYVCSVNHQFDPLEYINHIPTNRVVQFHLAGHSNNGTHIVDTHDAPIIEPVWDLFAVALKRFGKVSTLIERDDNFPPLSELLSELERAKQTVSAICDERVVC